MGPGSKSDSSPPVACCRLLLTDGEQKYDRALNLLLLTGGWEDMALLGEKCDRCGTRTRNREDDRAICEACSQEMALMVEASAESERLCPVDGQKMTKESAHMLVIDRCATCQGVWLDGGELERIRGGAEEAALRSMAIGFTSPFA